MLYSNAVNRGYSLTEWTMNIVNYFAQNIVDNFVSWQLYHLAATGLLKSAASASTAAAADDDGGVVDDSVVSDRRKDAAWQSQMTAAGGRAKTPVESCCSQVEWPLPPPPTVP